MGFSSYPPAYNMYPPSQSFMPPQMIPNYPPMVPKQETNDTKPPTVLRFDLTTEAAQKEFVNATRKEKEEDELRRDFPQYFESIKKLDENCEIYKNDYDTKLQSEIRQLEDLKNEAYRKYMLVCEKESELKQIHIKIEKELKELNYRKYGRRSEERKASDVYIKNLESKYSISDCPKDNILEKLDKDIEEFYEWMQLEEAELKPIKDSIIQEIKTQVHQIDPHLDIRIYGSYAVDLSLPMSDIDIIIFCTQRSFHNHYDILQNLMNVLKHKKGVILIKVIKNNSMPVLRVEFNEEMASAKLDITVNIPRHKGMECVEMTRQIIKEFPCSKKIILVIRYILKITELNDPYLRGLSSYGVLLLLTAYMQHFNEIVKDMSVSKLFLNILDFYGNFNFSGISVVAQYPYNEIFKNQIFDDSMKTLDVPVVIDPLVTNTTNNVTKSTANMQHIQMIFRIAATSIYHNCECINHRDETSASKKVNDKHCLLTNLFAAILPFKLSLYKKDDQ